MRRSNMNENSRRRARRFEIIALVGRIVCVLLILVGIIMLVKIWEDQNLTDSTNTSAGELISAPEKKREIVTYNGKNYALRNNLETTLIIGYDGNSDDVYDGGVPTFNQGDLLFLVVADKSAGTYNTLHINRDTMTVVEELTSKGVLVKETVAQVALAYAYGGTDGIRCRNTVKSVSTLLGGIKINHYVAVGMDSVPMLNDSVGGVTLTVMDDINDELKQGETVTLLGEQALAYVRARMSIKESTNLHRMERQKQYLEAFRPLFVNKAEQDASFVLDVLMQLGDRMYSDCPVDRLAQIVSDLTKMEGLAYLTIEGEIQEGEEFLEFYPDVAALREMIMSLFYEEVD